jgi:hypothetical protein
LKIIDKNFLIESLLISDTFTAFGIIFNKEKTDILLTHHKFLNK